MTFSLKAVRYVVMFGVLIWFLYLVNSGILRTENNIANGTLSYFDLAPRDPRSLIQGDYMVLRYAIEADVRDAGVLGLDAQDGKLVVRLDENKVANYVQLYDDETLDDNEHLVSYRVVGDWGINVGVESFFFQEGLADVFANARYAEVRLTNSGTVFLINLVNAEFEVLGTE